MAVAVEVNNLRKSYGEIRAVDGLSFRIDRGEIFGMLGPNGAGKTTTVEILVGLRRRNGGSVAVLGYDPDREPKALKQKIGVQLQTASLYPRLNVKEIVKLFGSFYQRALPPNQVIEAVGLQEKVKTQVRNLSGGQLQRLAVAIALVNDGELIFLDEPTTGLDPQARHGIWELVLRLKAAGKTIFLTTHYMDEAERLCDQVAVVDHGRIIALGSPLQLIEENFQERALELSNSVFNGDRRLKELPGVRRVQTENELTTIYTTEVSVTIAAMMELATSEGKTIGDLVVRQATLEDVFLKLTGRRIRQ